MLIAFAALAGAFLPPISVLTRTMWRHRFDDERTRIIAFSLDGVLIELAFTVGPMIVATLLARRRATVGVRAALRASRRSPCRCSRSRPRSALAAARSDAGTPPARAADRAAAARVYAVTLLFTFCLGLTRGRLPGLSRRQSGAPPLAGILLAINSASAAPPAACSTARCI